MDVARANPDSEAPIRLTSKTRWYAILLSLFLVLHLGIVAFVPNRTTWLQYRFGRMIQPYVNVFELSSGWSFFAPEPGPPPLYIEWQKLAKNGEIIDTGRWPDVKDPFFFRDRQNRRVAAARYMVNGESRADRMLTPYLCAQEPKAHAIRLWRIVAGIPGLYEVADGTRTVYDEKALERSALSMSFCDEN